MDINTFNRCNPLRNAITTLSCSTKLGKVKLVKYSDTTIELTLDKGGRRSGYFPSSWKTAVALFNQNSRDLGANRAIAPTHNAQGHHQR